MRALILELFALFPERVAIVPAFTPQPSNFAFQDLKMDFRHGFLAEVMHVGFDQ
jgi:hypothetical protein